MDWINKHRQKAKKLSDIFSDTSFSALFLAHITNSQMDTTSRLNANDWVNAMNEYEKLGETIEYNDDGTVKMPDFLG